MSSRGTSIVDGGAAGAVAALDAAVDGLQSLELWRLGDADLAGLVGVAHRVESRCAALGVAVLGEAVERGLPAAEGAKDGAGWLRGLVPVTPSTASARAGLAAALGTAAKPVAELARTRAGFAAGDLSAGHARVIVRTMDALSVVPAVDEVTRGEVQALMVGHAPHLDPAQLGKAGRAVRNRLDPDAAGRLAGDEDAQERARDGFCVQQSSGMWLVHAVLPPLAGASLCAALDPLAAPRPAGDGIPDPRTRGQRFADALTGLAELSLAARAGQPGSLPRRGGSAARLLITADLTTLTTNLHPTGPGSAFVPAVGPAGLAPATVATGEPGGWQISPLTLQTLSCEAELVPVLLDDVTGRPLDVGRSVYPFPPHIRKAIELRDRHCTHPGCTAPPTWCHIHHLQHWSRGGRTSEDNGGLLCGRHHRRVHADGLIGQVIDGHVVWRDPNRDDGDGMNQSNAFTQHFERHLRALATRWLNRNPHLRGRPPDFS